MLRLQRIPVLNLSSTRGEIGGGSCDISPQNGSTSIRQIDPIHVDLCPTRWAIVVGFWRILEDIGGYFRGKILVFE